MSEKFENQSKTANNKHQNEKSDKNNDENQHLIELDKKLRKMTGESPLADYDNLSQEDKEKLRNQDKKYATEHEENNYSHEEQATKNLDIQNELLRMPELLRYVLNDLGFTEFLKAIKYEDDWKYIFKFCSHGSKWRIINNKLEALEEKELILNKIATDMFELLENDHWIMLIAQKD